MEVKELLPCPPAPVRWEGRCDRRAGLPLPASCRRPAPNTCQSQDSRASLAPIPIALGSRAARPKPRAILLLSGSLPSPGTGLGCTPPPGGSGEEAPRDQPLGCRSRGRKHQEQVKPRSLGLLRTPLWAEGPAETLQAPWGTVGTCSHPREEVLPKSHGDSGAGSREGMTGGDDDRRTSSEATTGFHAGPHVPSSPRTPQNALQPAC